MAIGRITTPTTWVVGTVFPPGWGQSVQDNLNGLLGSGSAPTLVSLQVDGAGGNTATVAAGVIQSSGQVIAGTSVKLASSGSSTGANAAAKNTLFADTLPFAMGYIDMSGPTITRSLNVASINVPGSGVCDVTFTNAAANSTYIVSVTPDNASCWAYGDSSTKTTAAFRVGAKTVNTQTATNIKFYFVVYAIAA